MFDLKGKQFNYFNESFNEVVTISMGIELICAKCSFSFSSKSHLHKELKVGCARVVQAMVFPSTQPILLISIIETKAIISLLRLGLAF